jgi:fructosamine-3-kinase
MQSDEGLTEEGSRIRLMSLQNAGSSHWLNDDLRRLIERRVSRYRGAPWRIEQVQDRTDFASHPAAVLSGAGFAVFVKAGEGALAVDRFQRELAGLRLLSTQAGVLTPAGIGLLEVSDSAVVVMQAVQEIERDAVFWPQMGQALAQMHSVKGRRFGLETHAYWGDLYQDNTPADDWATFFWERRLAPRLKAAVDSGHLPAALVAPIEWIGARLPALIGPAVAPALLHGDAHKNNCLNTLLGPVFIDPAVYYGHPEMDLAYMDFFEPVPGDLLGGYAEIAPLDAGFVERRELWRLPARLAMVEVNVPHALDRLSAAVRNYL